MSQHLRRGRKARAQRQASAQARAEARATLTDRQQLKSLDQRGFRAKKERERLAVRIAKQKKEGVKKS